MLHVHTETQLLQDPPLRFDDLVFGVNVVLIKYQWTWSPIVWRNQNKIMFPPLRNENKKTKCPFDFLYSFSFFPFQPTQSNRLNCLHAWQSAGVCGLLWFQWKLMGSADSPQPQSPRVTALTEISTRSLPTSLFQHAETFLVFNQTWTTNGMQSFYKEPSKIILSHLFQCPCPYKTHYSSVKKYSEYVQTKETNTNRTVDFIKWLLP